MATNTEKWRGLGEAPAAQCRLRDEGKLRHCEKPLAVPRHSVAVVHGEVNNLCPGVGKGVDGKGEQSFREVQKGFEGMVRQASHGAAPGLKVVLLQDVSCKVETRFGAARLQGL